MKLLLILTSSILLLSSCTQYRYDVTYEKCNGHTGSLQYIGSQSPYIETYKKAVPILQDGLYTFKILNVCDFSYTRNPIE